MNRIAKKTAVFSALITGLLTAGCSLDEKPKAKEAIDPNQPTHYTISVGPTQGYQDPLPNYVPIFVDWHLAGGGLKQTLAYRGWDFDKDGRLDMVEVLNKDQTKAAFVFDFDRDGHVDMIRRFD